MTGSFRSAGMTFYMRKGQVIGRVAHSMEKRSNTLPQFVQRQKMRHSVALWQMLKPCRPMFTQHLTDYQGFVSLANRMPVVYVPQSMNDASLLVPGIPVSDGTLPAMKQWLGEVNGVAALMTDLKTVDTLPHEKLWLYTAEQHVEGGTPRVWFYRVREVLRREMTDVDGCLALTGEEFADEMRGWALVRTDKSRCSSQGLVTRCTYYERFTTEEALKAAAKSYHGLTK